MFVLVKLTDSFCWFPIARGILTAVFLVGLLVNGRPTSSMLMAQAPHTHDDQQQPKIVPETPEFKAACDKLREHLKKMRETIVRFNVSKTPAEERSWKQKWYELQDAGHELHMNMLMAALAEA